MKVLSRVSCALVAVAISGATAWAQIPASASDPDVQILVTQPEPLPSFGKIEDFVTTLVKLRLTQAGFLRLSQGAPDLPCTTQGPSARQNSKGPAAAVSYRISVDLHVTQPNASDPRGNVRSPEFGFDYQLLRMEGCNRTQVIQHSDTFTESSLFQTLRAMTDVLALALRSDAVRVPIVTVRIAPSETTLPSSPTHLAEVTEGLAAHALRALNSNGELDARLATSAAAANVNGVRPDYSVVGRFAFQLEPATQGTEVVVTFDIQSKTGATRSLVVTDWDQPQALARLYAAVGAQVHDKVDDLRASDAAGLPQGLSDEAITKELRTRAQALLCPTAGDQCIPALRDSAIVLPSLKDAELVLERLVNQMQSPSAEAWEWLGVARYNARDYEEAAEAFDSAFRVSQSDPDKLRLLERTADSRYSAKNYGPAAEAYQSVLALADHLHDPLHADPEAYIRWSRSLRSAGKLTDAARALLSGLPAVLGPSQPALRTELAQLVEGAASKDLMSVSGLTATALKNGSFVPATPDPFLDALVTQLLLASEAAYDFDAFSDMDRFLTQAKQIDDSGSVSPELQDRREVLSASLLRDRNGVGASPDDYANAERMLSAVVDKSPRNVGARLALATTYATWPKQGSAGDPYRARASSQLRSLIDIATAKATLVQVMGLCSDTLADTGCAMLAAQKLDSLNPADTDPATQLDIAEIEVLAGQSGASLRLARVMSQPSLPTRFKVVALFYQVWLTLADKGRADAAQLLIKDWQSNLGTLRQTAFPIGWTFDGARAALSRGVAGLNAQAVSQLAKMLDQMQ
jgi:tetratricopeptide (TPR) repeat protein